MMNQQGRVRDSGRLAAIGMALMFDVLVALVSVPVLAVVVYVPDQDLEAAIRDAIGKSTGYILDSDLVGLTDLMAFTRGISNLEGIQLCENGDAMA